MFQTARLARPRHLLSSVGLMLSLSAAVLAAPPVLDRVPTDALIVVAAPSLDRLSKSVQTVTSSIHLPMPAPGLTELLSMSGFEKGVDTTKSIAVVVLPMSPEEAAKAKAAAAAKEAAKPKKAADDDEDMDADEDDGPPPPTVVLVPTADYAALSGNFNAKPGAAGAIDSVEVSGKPMFIKSIGDGYAAMSDAKENLERFTGKGGNAKAHETALGKTCGSIADASDLVVIANMAAIKASPGPSLQERLKQMARNAPMGGPMGGAQLDGMVNGMDKFTDQSRIAVMGMKADASGVSIDMAAQFNEGTEMAKSFSKPGNASGLIKKLPKQDYLFAFAADMSDPTMREMAKKMNPAAQMAGNAEGKDAEKVLNALMGPIDKADGMAVSLGASPAAMMGGGLFTNTVAYVRTADPDGYIKASEQAFKDLNDKTIEGTAFATTYTPGTSKVNDVSVDTWSMKITPDEDEAGGMAGQIMMGLFGPNGGPAGYLAKADGGVVRTMGKNSLLMSASLDAAKGNNSMGADTLVAQVGEKLPAGRSIEAYVGIKSFLDMVKPMMAMMGGGADPEIPDVIPPIGFGMGGTDGAGRATIYIPMPVIKAISNVAQAFQGAGMGGDMEDEEDAPAPKDAKPGDKGAGQPKF